MGDFADAFVRFHRKVIANADKSLQAGVMAIAHEAIARTPVATGTLANSWNITSAHDPMEYFPQETATASSPTRLDAAIKTMSSLEPYYYFGNATPYAEDVEFYGGSIYSPDPKGSTTFDHTKPKGSGKSGPKLMLSSAWPLFAPAVEAEATKLGRE